MKKLLLIMIFYNLHFSYAQIHETITFNQIQEFVKEKTLYLFDIDNTIYHPVQHLGSEAWFRSHMQNYLNEGFTFDESLEKAIYDWMTIQHITKVSLVEEGIDTFIDQMQKENHVIMGFTARDKRFHLKTVEQLNSVGVNLKVTAPILEELNFSDNERLLYKDGILFTSGSDKGKALLAFLKKIHFSPKRIVFIDDKVLHLDEVANCLQNTDIQFIGIRYGGADKKVQEFDEQAAKLQFEHFKKIMSDEEAQALLEKAER